MGERQKAWLFEFDERWSADEHFVLFDYREGAAALASELASQFDLILADPPNMQLETIEKYALVIRFLAASADAKTLFVSSSDWHGLMLDRLGAFPVAFRPVMPTSAWSQCGRFRLYANYRHAALSEPNPEA